MGGSLKFMYELSEEKEEIPQPWNVARIDNGKPITEGKMENICVLGWSSHL